MDFNQKLISLAGDEFLKGLTNPEIRKQYGWIPLALPVMFYAVNQGCTFLNNMMEKGYECNLKTKAFELNLTKPQQAVSANQ